MNMMNPKEIKTHPTFEKLFPVRDELLERIEEDMLDNKFDLSQPVILATWEGQDEPVCIDGHTRLQAALKADIDQIPVWIREDFETEQDALEHAIKLQSNRRNMTDAELMACIGTLDQIRPRGGNSKGERTSSMPQSCGKESGRSASAKETSEIVGCSPRKVEQARTVKKHADEETLEAIRKGEKSINRAYEEIRTNRKEANQKGMEAEAQEEQIQATESEVTVASTMGAETEEEGETDPEESEISEDDEADAAKGEQPHEEGFIKVRISAAQYEALSEYEGTVEEMVEEAIALYLERREQEEEWDRAELERMWANTDEDDENEEGAEDVEAA